MSQLHEKGLHTVVKPFFDKKAYIAFYQSGNLLSKVRAIVESYWRRLILLLHVRSFDHIFIHREATPAGPPVIEWVIAVLLKKQVIYDFDDAIWLTDKPRESTLAQMIRWRSKVKSICRWSYRVSCGNEHLAKFARQYNPNVTVNPTTIDTREVHIPDPSLKKNSDRVVIGWTGSHSTLKYLSDIVPVLQALEAKYPKVETFVIADRNPQLPLKNFRYQPWRVESEIEDLLLIDIGIMPLPEDEWTKGKCGFKALQYMALEIPSVVSPVGVNREIIEHGIEGFVSSTSSEWLSNLENLILNASARRAMGKKGRQKVDARYSVNSNSTNFLSLFQ